jgi:cation transport ATPase
MNKVNLITDKGTITEGKPSVEKVFTSDEDSLLQSIASLNQANILWRKPCQLRKRKVS